MPISYLLEGRRIINMLTMFCINHVIILPKECFKVYFTIVKRNVALTVNKTICGLRKWFTWRRKYLSFITSAQKYDTELTKLISVTTYDWRNLWRLH